MKKPTTVRVFALAPGGPEERPVPAGVTTVHGAYDGYPLGVYTALRTFGGSRFLGLERHLDRTDRSMELLGWSERLDRPSLRRGLEEVVRSTTGGDLVCRIDHFAAVPEQGPPGVRTYLATAPLVPVPAEMRRLGVGVTLGKLRRRDPRIKEASFVLDRRPNPKSQRLDFEDLIQDDRGRVLEGSSSNVYVFAGGRWITPRAEALPGITQGYLIELLRARGEEVVERPIEREDLVAAEEAFLSSSTRGVIPIVQVDGERVADGHPGSRTLALIEDYADLVAREAR